MKVITTEPVEAVKVKSRAAKLKNEILTEIDRLEKDGADIHSMYVVVTDKEWSDLESAGVVRQCERPATIGLASGEQTPTTKKLWHIAICVPILCLEEVHSG